MKLSSISPSGKLSEARGSIVAVPFCLAKGYCWANDGLESLQVVSRLSQLSIPDSPEYYRVYQVSEHVQ